MNLAFCLFKYFPFGGLQRDFMRIARICQGRGHSIHVFTMEWEGETPFDFHVTMVSKRGLTNHRQCLGFAEKMNEFIERDRFHAVIGFNKLPNLDVYYAADPCYKARVEEQKSFLYRLGPRYHAYAALERAVFEPSAGTHVLLISENEKAKFIHCYGTPEERFHSLPPGISRDRILPANAEEVRRYVRAELGVAEDESLLLMIGSSFRTKGLDRSVLALADLPEPMSKKTKLFVIGRGNPHYYKRMAKRHHVADRLNFLGGRDDVPRYLLGADLLLHPAYSENTGTVLLEAMASGLPVLASDVCGYAGYIRDADAGRLIPSPFKQSQMNELLKEMLVSSERAAWKSNGIHYAQQKDLYSLTEKAADIIEHVTGGK